MPKVSVIVPVYKVENYIERCVRSLFEQTLDDIEYVFVNDCTPDKSIDILKNVLEEYPYRKPFVQIINTCVNSGLGIVRRIGVEASKGDYIICCDSDDHVDRDMYRRMYEATNEGIADIVICDITFCQCKAQYIVYSKLSRPGLAGLHYTAYIFCKLVKRELFLRDLQWPRGNMLEDLTLTIQLLKKAKTIEYLAEPYYFYTLRDDSICGRKDKDAVLRKWKEIKSNVDIICRFLPKTKNNMEKMILKDFARCVLNPCISDHDVWNEYRNAYPEIDKPLILSRNVSFRNKVRIVLYRSALFHNIAYKLFSKAGTTDYR